MAQTIQIKRSSSTVAPTSLASGELAYSFKSGTQKLYIGDGSNVLAIGGKSYMDKLDLIGSGPNSVIATASNLGVSKLSSDTTQTVAANSVTATASRTYGIQHNSSDQMVVNVPWVDTNTEYTAGTGLTLSGTVFNANVDGTNSVAANASTSTASRTYKVQVDSLDNLVVNVPWTDSNESLATTLGIGNDTSGSDIDVSAGDDITFSTTSKAIFGGTSSTSNRMEIYHDGTQSRIEEYGTGGLIVQGEDLTFQDAGGAIAMKMTTVGSDRVFEFRDGSDVQIAQFKAGEIKINSSSELKTDDISETTSAHGVHIDGVILKDGEVEGNIKTDLISEKTAANGVVIDSVTLKDGGVTANSLDINGDADISGNLTLTGNLNITGDVNSQNVTDLDVTDKTITVGVGQTAATSSNSGITVAGADAKIVYEYDTTTNTGIFEIDQGAGTQSAILTAANWGTEYTGAVDGGTF